MDVIRVKWVVVLLGVASAVPTSLPEHATKQDESIQLEETDNDSEKQLLLEKLKELCKNVSRICNKHKDLSLCTVRLKQIGGDEDEREYKDYDNLCLLNFDNFCNQPEHEYVIVQSGSCAYYLDTRRTDTKNATTTKTTTMKRIYGKSLTWDNRPCPYSCTDVYSPQCMKIHETDGLNKRMLLFMNRCHAYVYFCKNYKYLKAPEDSIDEYEINVNGIDFSDCGSSRYLQFARFTDTASALGHYGWLRGSQNYRHIMTGRERG